MRGVGRVQYPDLSSPVGDGRPSSAACDELGGFISLIEASSALLDLADLYLYRVNGVEVAQVFVRWGRRPVGVTYLAGDHVAALCTLVGRRGGGLPLGAMANPFTGSPVEVRDLGPCPLPLDGCRLVDLGGVLAAYMRLGCAEIYSGGVQFLVACKHLLRWSMEGVDTSADFARDVARILSSWPTYTS